MHFDELAITILVLSIFWIILRYIKVFHINGLHPAVMSWSFLIRLASGLIFLYIYSVFYGNGNLSADAGSFLRQSRTLNEVFYDSPSAYLKFLTGIGESRELIEKYLMDTHHWDAGTLTLVNDNKNLLRFHSLIHFISAAPLVHLAFSIFFAQLGTRLIFLSFRKFVSIPQHYFYWITFLIPGVLFWTSAILKEPLMFLGIALLCSALFIKRIWWKRGIHLLLALFLLLSFKPYVLICIVPVLFFTLVYYSIGRKKLVRSSLFSLVILIAGLFIFSKQSFKVLHIISRKQFDFVNVGRGGMHVIGDTSFYYFTNSQLDKLTLRHGLAELNEPVDALVTEFGSIEAEVPVHLVPKGEKWPIYFLSVGCTSYIPITPIRDSYVNLLKCTPEAFVNSNLRPWPWDPGSWLKWLAFLETLAVVGLIVFSFRNRRKLSVSEGLIVFQLLIFALVLSLLIGYTTPVLGAIVRYRFPVSLAIVIVCCILLKPFQIKKWRIIFS